VGPLKLPTSGLVYFDSQAVIYSVETHADYWSGPCGVVTKIW